MHGCPEVLAFSLTKSVQVVVQISTAPLVLTVQMVLNSKKIFLFFKTFLQADP